MRFCGACGTALVASAGAAPTAATPAEAERRQLTVVFCDVVGSSTLSTQLDPEDFQELLARYQECCASAIGQMEGHVAQFLGDGVLAYFGYPRAHEDDARRAIEAALTLVDRVAALRVHGHSLQVRVGIHTGLAVIGGMRAAGHEETLAVGETPNIAARIQGEAHANAILISESTYRLARRHFDVELLESRLLRGFSKETVLYRVRGRLDPDAAAGMAGDDLTPFTGREKEISVLRDEWGQARAGGSRVVHLSADPGIGKSRLLWELKAEALRDKGQVVEWRCSPYRRNTAFFPIADALSRALHLDRSADDGGPLPKLERWLARYDFASASDVAPLASALNFGPEAVPSALSPQRQRLTAIDILIKSIQHDASDRPLLLVVEDLHWTDPSTIELLQEMIEHRRPASVLVALSYRPEFRPPWERVDGATYLTLAPIGSEQAELMIRRVAGDRELPADLVARIGQRAEGVPLFLEEITRAVLEGGDLTATHGDGSSPLGGELIPATVRDSLASRIDRLGDARYVIRMAAVLGRDFSFRLLQAVTELPEKDLRRSLEALEEAHLVFRQGDSPDATYVFKHALIQDVAYDSLIRRVRQQHHKRVAEAMLRDFPQDADAHPELVAAHCDSAGDFAQALPHWRTAGVRALQRAANREAIAHLTSALRSLDAVPSGEARDREELALQLSLMAAEMAIFGWADARVEACCSRAIELATRLADYPTLFGASWGMWTVHFLRCHLELAGAEAERVLAMASATGLPFMQPPARHAVGFTEYCYGRYASASEQGRRCQEMASLEVEQALVNAFQFPPSTACLSYLAACLFLLGDPAHDEVRAQSFALGGQLQHSPSNAFLLGFNIYVFHLLEDAARIRAMAPELDRLTRDEGFAAWIPVAEIFLGWIDATGGKRDGVDRMRRAIESKSGTRNLFTHDHLLLAEGLVGCGDDEGALGALELAIGFWNETHLALMVPEVFRLRAEILGRRADAGGALESFDRAIALARSHEARSLALRAAVSRHRWLRSIGRDSEGRSVVQEALADLPAAFDSVDVQRARALLATEQ